MTLTKSHIVDHLWNQTKIPKQKCVELVETVLEIIKDELSKGNDVLVWRFGKFSVKEKNPRRGRNPHTGEPMMLGRRKIVMFRTSGKLRERMNGR
jgi:integration host factor subunit alpha